MLAAEAMRLAAIEVLCPTAALAANAGYPTLAGRAVADSRAVALEDIDHAAVYTPALSLHTRSSAIERRGEAADETDNACLAVLEVIGELAVVARDKDGAFADAMAADDPDARLVLSALMSQVRFLLEFSQAGHLFRDTIIGVRRIEEETFGAPELGVRYQRVTMRITAAVPDDRFDVAAGGMPEPLKSLQSSLPVGSYSKAKLAQLAAAFAADPRPALDKVTILGAPDGEPIASTGDLKDA